MKLIYILALIFFMIKISNILYDYTQTKDIQQREISLTEVKPIGFHFDLKNDTFIFQDKGWNIKRKKEKIIKKEDTNLTVKKPLLLHLDQFPITICDAKECFEFIGLENNHALFYGSSPQKKEGFIKVTPNNYLNKQIFITEITPKEIKFYDLDFNKTLKINMFDLNISKYTPKQNKDLDNENK